MSANEHAGLFLGEVGPFQVRLGRNLLPITCDVLLPIGRRQSVDQWVLRSEHHVSRAIKGVVPGGENPDGWDASLRRQVIAARRPCHSRILV